jgi:regulator of protease activity HflC (stomatin/prohibitin superfamily)
MFKKIRIRKHEVGLWFRHGDLKRVLDAGAHWVATGWPVGGRLEVHDRTAGKFEHKLLDVLAAEPALAERLHVADLKDDERALVWKDGRLGWILGPGRHAFWKGPAKIEVETFGVDEFTFTHRKIEAILGFAGGSRFLDGVRVEPHERIVLFREGELIGELGPGLHVFWKHAGKITWKSVDLREQTADVSGQEIMTADKVTLRVNLVVTYRVTDVHKVVTVVADHAQTLYREAQLALRESVGARPLDGLLTDKDAVGNEVRNALAGRAAEYGLAVRSVGLRDVILPGEMKVILNEVILAEKQAQANLIRRREETAAARSQANTARLLAENPALARMKELEQLAEIVKGTRATFVLGSGDLAEQVRGLIGGEGAGP